MTDQLIRATLSNLHLRVIMVEFNSLFEELLGVHKPPRSCRHHFFKALASGLLTSPLLKEDERYTLRWHYGTSLEILVDVNETGGIRCTLQPPIEEEEMNIENLPGKLGVVKSSSLRRLNDGMVLADLCDPAEDLATFFNLSDQIPSFCRAMVEENTCRGILIQGLPGCSAELFEDLETRWKQGSTSIPPLHQKKHLHEFLSDLIGTNLSSEALRSHDSLEPHSFCTCGKEKMRNTLASLPATELEDMIREDGGAQIDCQFCGSGFRFEAQDLRAMIDAKS